MTGKIEKQGLANLVLLYAGIGLGLLNTILRTKALTAEEIGLIGILLSISSVTAFLIAFGLPAGILKFYGRFRSSVSQKTFYIIICLSIVTVLTLVASGVFDLVEPLLASKYDNPLLEQYIRYIYFLFLFGGFNVVLGTVLRAEHRTVFVNFTMSFFDRVLFLGFLSMMLIFPQLDFETYFWFFVGTYCLKTVMLALFLARKVRLGKPSSAGFDRPLVKEMATYSSFMLFAGLAGVITAAVDRLMLGYYVNLDAVGVYTIVLTFPMLLRMIGSGFGMIANPIIADCFHAGDMDEVQRIYSSNINIQLLLGGGFMAVFVAFGQPGLDFLGEAYSRGFWVMIFLATGEYLNIATGMCGTIIAFSKKYRLDFYLRVFLLLIAVATNMVLIPVLGIEGAAIATASSLAIYNLGKVVYVRIKFRMQPYSFTTLGVLSYSAALGIALWLFQRFAQLSNIGLIIGVSAIAVLGYVLLGAVAFKLTPAIELLETVDQLIGKGRKRR